MAAKIVDLTLYKQGSNLDINKTDDPCSQCDAPRPCSGCERANAWWDQFAKAFNKKTGG